ncbi:MAG: SDR family NAD(P)-dependent oxidoreductase, partial [Nitratireductor sp.]
IMKRHGHGNLVVISSVAGDRGRPSNWAYGGAKAMLSVMGEGMGLELGSAGVNVVVVKPGFVDTPMTADFPKGPLWASTDQVAGSIVRAVRRKRRGVIYAPGWWRWIMLVVAFAPGFLVKRL